MADGKTAVPMIRTMTNLKKQSVGGRTFFTCSIRGIGGQCWVVPIGKPFTSPNLELVADPPRNMADRWVGEFIMSSEENRLTYIYQANACHPVGRVMKINGVKVQKYQFYKQVNKPKGVVQPRLWVEQNKLWD